MADSLRSGFVATFLVTSLGVLACTEAAPLEGEGSAGAATAGASVGGTGPGAAGAPASAGSNSTSGGAGAGGTGTTPMGDSGSAVGGAMGGTAMGGAAGGGSAGSGSAGAAGAPASGTGEIVPPVGGMCGTSWKNPITAGTHDPSVIKAGNTYYAFRTGRNVGFSTSTDKLTWGQGGSAMPSIPEWANGLGLAGAPDIWAPDVHFAGGKYYLYYSVSSWGDITHSAVGLMTNTALDPKAAGYKWVDQGLVVGSPEGGAGVNVIDPNLFIDDDGRWWLVYGSFQKGLRLIELNPTTGLAKERPLKPVTLTTSLGEGASLIKAYGYYYLFASRGHCCDGLDSTYEIVYGRSTKVEGPYVNASGQPINGNYVKLLASGADGNPGQGGQSFFMENGQWHMDYHAYQPPSGGSVLNIRPIYFDADGWVTLDRCKAKGYKP